jgi:hypothetical protein
MNSNAIFAERSALSNGRAAQRWEYCAPPEEMSGLEPNRSDGSEGSGRSLAAPDAASDGQGDRRSDRERRRIGGGTNVVTDKNLNHFIFRR